MRVFFEEIDAIELMDAIEEIEKIENNREQ